VCQVRIGTKIAIGGVVMGLVLSTTPAAAAFPGSASAAPGTDDSGGQTVTLITGDQVTVRNNTTRSVRPAKGREGTAFQAFSAGGHLYVIPADAGQLVATGRVDRRLFDITTLLEFGYDDAHRATVPLIISHPAGSVPRLADATLTRELPSIDAIAVSAAKSDATAVWDALTDGGAARTTTRTAAAGVSRVWLDGRRRSTVDHSVPRIGAPTAWEAGYTGTGVTVAVLDTGVDQTHPDLADREIAERNFSGTPDNVDHFGHGTHVASIVAGTGARSGGTYRGVAHGASILDGKVLDDNGYGSDSGIIAGMEWAAEQGADVVNLSLGGGDTPDIDPMEEAVNRLSEQYDTLFVIAAGNSGPDAGTVSSPGSAAAALTVGAVDRTDALPVFSGRGPTVGDGAIKPDVTAPGVDIVAALHSAGTINNPVADGYTALSGTSMASPHVAGAAALLAQQHPDWTGERLKAVLSGSATPNPAFTAYEQGAGRIDVAAALDQTIVSDPVNVSMGTQTWPHDDQEPVARSVTYRNFGDIAVTLALSVDAVGPDGAPADVFTLSANEITVPAAGEAQVTVTGDTRGGTADGAYSGTVVASAGGSVTRTPVGIHREAESYDLTLSFLDENGAPTGEYRSVLVGLDNSYSDFPYDPDGTVKLRLPRGRYLLDHLLYTEGGEHWNLLVQPGVVLDRDLTFTVDARTTKPVSVTPPVSARLELADIGYSIESAVGSFSSALLVGDLGVLTTAQLGGAQGGDRLTGKINTQWLSADGAFYGLAWFPAGKVPSNFTKVVRQRDLATVRAEFGASSKGHSGKRSIYPYPAVGMGFVWSVIDDVGLPGSRTEYHTTEGTVWNSRVEQIDATGLIHADWTAPTQTYRAGRTYAARFVKAVYGPGAARSDHPNRAVRYGDNISVTVPLFTDGHGNTGFSMVDRATTSLYLDGKLVEEVATPANGYFEDLPPGPGTYKLTTEVVRPAVFDLSTAVSAEWTFRSSHVGEGRSPALGVNFVRYLPELDANNSVRANRVQLLPLQLQDQRGAALTPARMSVEVSYDEGKTWRSAPVLWKSAAVLHHPKGAKSVSLRATATDRAGNTVKQTVIRAYTLRT
jgi:subtilisin family serine protease